MAEVSRQAGKDALASKVFQDAFNKTNLQASSGAVNLFFATLEYQGDSESVRIVIEPLTLSGRAFPMLLQDAEKISDLQEFQNIHFTSTYLYYGIESKHILCYAVFIYDTDEQDYKHFGLCHNQEEWRVAVTTLSLMVHKRGDCTVQGGCSTCNNTPRIVICLNKQYWDEGALARPPHQSGVSIIYRDDFEQEYAARLLSIDSNLHEQYTNLIRSAKAQLDLERGIPPRSSHDPTKPTRPRSDDDDDDDDDEDDSNNGNSEPSKVRAAKSGRDTKTANKASKPEKDQPRFVTGPKNSHRVFADPIASPRQKSRDWTKATDKPSGQSKTADQKCLTCINFGRGCTGLRMVWVKNKRGEQELRCEICANANRVCYWRDTAQGITTYDDAKRVLDGYQCAGNSRSGRADRARRKLSELGLDDEGRVATSDGEEEEAVAETEAEGVIADEAESEKIDTETTGDKTIGDRVASSNSDDDAPYELDE